MQSDPLIASPSEHFAEQTTAQVPFRNAFLFWLKLGFINFGGPTGQIAIMHHELVNKRKWINEDRFLHALSYCMLLPGPEAQQLAIYTGWLLHGTKGGIVAGSLFVIPSIVVLWILSYIYVVYGNVFWISSLFYGLRAAVLAIVAGALIRVARKALKNALMIAISLLAFISIYFLKLPFPWVILIAAALGFVGGKLMPATQIESSTDTEPAPKVFAARRSHLYRALKIGMLCVVLWWTPVLLARACLGRQHTLYQEGLFFSKAAMITFGGAYAVLPYVSQQAVERFGWLSAKQMIDGLALAETTPGPLIMVLQFVGFLGGWHHPGTLSPLIAATLGALMTTWVTFVPCFLWIFLGAPYIEMLRSYALLSSTLSAITAAVVGVILNLAVWFGIHTLFPAGMTIDWFLLTTTVVAFISVVRYKINELYVIFGCGLLGIAYRSLLGG